MSKFTEQLNGFWCRTEPARRWIYNLRGLFMAIPVVAIAVMEAIKNITRLPEEVGLLIQASGDYRWMVDRSAAVLLPLLITAASLVLMFCSRRAVYPWLVSIFTLILPFVIYITNVFPA